MSLHCLESVDLDFYYQRYPFRRQKLDAGTRIVYANRLRLLDILNHLQFSKVAVHDRYYFDTLFPAVNTRFVNEYTITNGAFAEALVESPNWLIMLKKAQLSYFALFGYWLPGNANMMMFCSR